MTRFPSNHLRSMGGYSTDKNDVILHDLTNPKEGLTQPKWPKWGISIWKHGDFFFDKKQPKWRFHLRPRKAKMVSWCGPSADACYGNPILVFCTWTMRSSLEKLWEDDVLIGNGVVRFWSFGFKISKVVEKFLESGCWVMTCTKPLIFPNCTRCGHG